MHMLQTQGHTAVVPTMLYQVGSYAFTTLRPQLGTIIDSNDLKPAGTDNMVEQDSEQAHNDSSWSPGLVLADLPGIVPGAHAGKGRGTAFLAHLQKARCLALVIDMTGREETGQLQSQPKGEDHGGCDATAGKEDEVSTWGALVPHTPQQQLSIIQVSQ